MGSAPPLGRSVHGGSSASAVALLALALIAIAAFPSFARSATTSGAVISNGTVQLGVNDRGDLNYDCASAGDAVCPAPSAGEGEGIVGVRYQPLNLDAISPGCQCEGWGVADAVSGLTGSANETDGTVNVTLTSFNAPTADRAVSIVTVADPSISGYQMQVRQDYHPSPLSPNLYVDTVTITNTGSNPLNDLRYRRAMDWDVEPTAFDEWVTIQGNSPQLLFDSDDGFAASDPLAGPSYIDSEAACGAGYTGLCQFTDLGFGGTYPGVTSPDDHGALFDFGLGQLSVGESRSFNIYYGAANSETAATSALQAGGAQVYSLGESNCAGDTIATCSTGSGHAGVEQGKPATFVFGFVTTIGDLSITKADSPDPVQVGQNLTYSITVNNNGPQAAAGVQVTDTLPAGVDFVSATPDQGACSGTSTVTCSLGALALNASAHISIVVKPTSVGSGSLSNTATVTSASSDANPANNTASASTTVTSGPDGAPDTIIDSGPSGSTSDSTPTFTFHATEAGSTFECSIDTGTPAFGPCSGPGASHTPPSALADGSYTFRVRATDTTGNTDTTPATRNFIVTTVVGAAPKITSTTPPDGFSGASRTAPIKVVFDQAMDKPSVEAAFSLKRSVNGEPVSGVFSWSGNTLIFTPGAPLAPSRLYTARVGTGARNLAGTHLTAPEAWQFSSTPQPLISFIYPADHAHGVSKGTPIVVAFDTAMDKPSAQAAFSLRRTSGGATIGGAFGWYGKALIFKPSVPLAPNTSYTARETNGARNLAGRPVEAGRTWEFTTAH